MPCRRPTVGPPVITLPAPGSTSEPTPQRLELLADATAPGLARQFVADRVTAFPEPTVEDALVLVSEIVTNAVRYGSGSIVLSLVAELTLIQVDVHDDGSELPPLESTRPGDDATHGRGLLIVQALATDWGVAPDAEGGGKTVWFELLV